MIKKPLTSVGGFFIMDASNWEEYIMSDLILNETKRVLFKAGSYIVATPKGNTSHWSVADWIMYIDKNGEWVQWEI